MLGERYVVRKGDNLWRIAAATLGRGKEWPRIWHYNNRPEVARVTGRRIPNPDLIYTGQLLLIPRLTTLPLAREPNAPDPPGLQPAAENMNAESFRQQPRTAPPDKTTAPLSEQLRRLKVPLVFRFRLGDISWPPQELGAATIQVNDVW